MGKTMKRILILAMTATMCVAVITTAGAQPRSSDFCDGWRFQKGPFAADSLLFDNGGWDAVKIPHTWNADDMQFSRNDYYAGVAGYAKSFTPTREMAGKRIFLRFEGVGSVADLYVDGKHAGRHEGGYSAFAVEITNLVEPERESTITLRADNTPREDVIPINNTLFPVYGGMYRPVSLVVTGKVNIAVTDLASPGVFIRQRDVRPESAEIEVTTRIDNTERTPRAIEVRTAVLDASGAVVASGTTPYTVSVQGRQSVTQTIRMTDPHLWQGLEDPYLHLVVVRLVDADGVVLDEVKQPLGVRLFELRAADGMYLNGKKVPMYGVCRHQDRLGFGSALSNAQHAEDLEIIREMGATTIRFAHYQQAEYIYAKCDSIGFIVWAEIPFVNRVSTREAAGARTQLSELIRQNLNHPSIYIWGLHNEVYTPEAYTTDLTVQLHDLAKMEDPDRPTVAVSGYGQVDRRTNLHADVQGINRYFGWYEGRIDGIYRWIDDMERDFPGYRVMLAEYGAEANISQQEETPGDRGRFFGQFYPETFSTKYHETHWAAIREHPYLLASYIWNTFDFATPATTQGGVPARNMKGLVTFDRKVRKDPYYWYKANWSSEPVLYITQRRATERVNRVTSVTVYSNIGRPQLFVNGTEYTPVVGLTPVHWIFREVKLRRGKNRVEARVGQHRDAIEWNWSPDNKPLLGAEGELAEEHTGL